MGVLIIHSHLRPGGVTRVIENQVMALGADNCRVLVGASDESEIAGAAVQLLPELNYLDPELNTDTHRALYRRLRSAILERLQPGDILHPHNMNLGKNPVATLVIADLAREGWPLYNHCHDFAEDGRPKNLELLQRVIEGSFERSLTDVLYASAKNIKYAVLNGRDRIFLQERGVAAEAIQLLPNYISEPQQSPVRDREQCLRAIAADVAKASIVYPVRVIRRKNIGEFILLATLFDEYNWCVTLAPHNPVEREEYLEWKEFCRTQGIAVHFDIGEELSFSEVMLMADRLITTSTQEGFGMAYLEPWLYNRAVFGRDIVDITKDFKAQGLDLRGFYPRLEVDGCDFATLAPAEQKKIVTRSLVEHSFATEIRSLEALAPLRATTDTTQIAHNAAVVRQHYSRASYATTLKDNYADITQ